MCLCVNFWDRLHNLDSNMAASEEVIRDRIIFLWRISDVMEMTQQQTTVARWWGRVGQGRRVL